MRKKSATPEEAWAAIEELAQAQKRIAKENAEGMKELRKAQELTEKERRKGEKERREGEKALREAQELTEKARREGEKERREGEKALREAQERTEKARREGEKARREGEKERREGEKALREAQEKTEKALRESQEKTEKALRELSKSLKESNQELTKNLNAANGNFNNKWGNFLENLVKGDLVKLLSKRNIKVDMVRSRLVASDSSGKEVGEFDVVAMNGKEIVTVEVKTTLTKAKVEKFINKLKMFKKYFSEHRDKVLYGGVAFLCEPESEEAESAAEYAEENGLFVILSPGGEGNVTTMSNSKDFKPRSF